VRSLNLEDLVVDLGLTVLDTSSLLANAKTIAGRSRGQVSAGQIGGLDFISVTAESTSPVEAAHLANLTVKAYKQRNEEAARSNISLARGYLERQLSLKQDSLRNAENDLTNFQESKAVISLDEETSGLVQQMSTLEAEREQAKIELESNGNRLSIGQQ